VKSAIEAYNAHDIGRAIDCEAESVIHYSPISPKGLQGQESARSSIKTDFLAFPDIQFKVDWIIGEADCVSVHGVVTGTNTGPYTIEKGKTVKASNRQIRIPQAYFHRLNGGKIVETYEFWDMRLLMAQLGFLRKNTFRALYLVAFGLVTMTADATILSRSDPLFPFSGLLGGIVIVILGTNWLAKTLLELSRTE
jgi:predicted ester cyclase